MPKILDRTSRELCIKSDGYTAKELAFLQQVDKELRPTTNKILTNKKDHDFGLRKGVVYKKK